MIDLRHIRHLLAIASHSTVQAAADAIHLTQPALTKSIVRFEEELGAKLFDRRGHRLALTEFGERMVERGEDLVRHVRELEEEVALWKGVGTGEVAIGVDPEAELSLLPAVLEKFVPAHPGVRLTVRSGHTDTLLSELLRGELHFLVADDEFALEREDLEIRGLAGSPIAVALRPGHPLARKRKPNPTDLEAFPVAGASTAPRFERWSVERVRREGAKPLPPTLVCDNYEVLVRLAERSDTMVFGPRDLLLSYERASRLKVMSWPLEGPETNPSLIRSKGRHLSPAAERLIGLFES
jgi:DNA-binding transcriptional LysR family regulator